MARAKRRKGGDSESEARSLKGRLKRRALVLGAVGLLSVVGAMVYDVGAGPKTHVVILNLTEAPVTDVVLTGSQGSWTFDRIAPARAESVKIDRLPDARFAFHLKYTEGGSVKETDLRMFAGKAAVTVIELAVNPKGVTTNLRSEETAADRAGRFFRGLRARVGL